MEAAVSSLNNLSNLGRVPATNRWFTGWEGELDFVRVELVNSYRQIDNFLFTHLDHEASAP